MPIQIINVGTVANDGTGDPLRTAFMKCNANFNEIYGLFPIDPANPGVPIPVAPIDDPVFTGDPQAPTPPPGDNDTSIATTAFVTAAVAAGTVGLAPLESPLFTGDPRSTTPPPFGDNDSSLATTAWVNAAIAAGGVTTPGDVFTAPIPAPQGRLTLAAGTPVMLATVIGQTTITYTPYIGSVVPLYDGTSFKAGNIGDEISTTTADTSHNPSAIGANKINDWFVWLDSSVPATPVVRLCHGPDWADNTNRSAGTALTKVRGIWLNNAKIGNGTTTGPDVKRGTYVGTTRSNATSGLDWIIGSPVAPGTGAIGGSPVFLGVWNAYNRMNVGFMVRDTADAWTTTSFSFEALDVGNGGLTGNRISLVRGLDEDAVAVNLAVPVTNPGVCGATVAIGLDSVFAPYNPNPVGTWGYAPVVNAGYVSNAFFTGAPGLGFHYFLAMQAVVGGAGTSTAWGDNGGPGYLQEGMGIITRA